jgi:hypothetical protein
VGWEEAVSKLSLANCRVTSVVDGEQKGTAIGKDSLLDTENNILAVVQRFEPVQVYQNPG